MKPLILALLLLLPHAPQEDELKQRIKTFRNSGRFSVRHDRFKDLTYVSVGPFFVGGTRSYVMRGFQLEMSAAFVKDSAPIDTIYLSFQSNSKGWTFLKSRDLYVLIDGQRMSLREGDRDSDIRRGSVSETLTFAIPAETMEFIGKAQSVEFKIGPIELTLKDEHKEAFRDLTSLSLDKPKAQVPTSPTEKKKQKPWSEMEKP